VVTELIGIVVIIFHLYSTEDKLVNSACISACYFVSALSFAQTKVKKCLLEHN